ncbi:MAG TPA: 50S ribosomal protein L29 [Candidatus Saccharimonadales bacterium]|nr:50S ribosomal protein L29 [Candidatus Saccharimonadales bacterium]
MKIADIRKQDTNDLAKQSSLLREEITEMRRRLYSGELTNVRAIRAKRKDLARVMTVLGEQLQKESL